MQPEIEAKWYMLVAAATKFALFRNVGDVEVDAVMRVRAFERYPVVCSDVNQEWC
jgi:hypothetical protein